jgi:TolB-like protein/DNA-binding winged helix-turn-helix (wHTH) protein
MAAKLQVPFHLGAWLVDPSLDAISRGTQSIKLEPRMMRLLTCLADSPGVVISQERLLAEVWAGVVVGPASVYQAVSQLRRLLGDTDPDPSYIATVPRKGYRLVAPVRSLPPPGARALQDLPGTPTVPASATLPSPPAPQEHGPGTRGSRRWAWMLMSILVGVGLVVWLAWKPARLLMSNADEGDSIVVLPLIDLSEEKKDQAFCDGLTEELSNWLAQIPTLRVVARTSAFTFRGLNEDVRAIGKVLGARHVLEGSMRRAGDHMRVSVQLVDARNGYQIWSSEYDRPFEDAIRIQEDISRSVAESLAIRLTDDTNLRFAARSTKNPEAYRLFLLARREQQDRSAESNAHAIQLYQQSLAADSQFALAYVGLAYATINQIHLNGRTVTDVSAATEPLLARAAQLEPDLSELYAVRAALREEQGKDSDALDDLNRAVTLNANDSWALAELARLHIGQGAPRDALQDIMRALALDPLDYILHARQCLVLQDLARFAQATAACERSRALHGSGGWDLLVSEWLAWSQGDLVQALNWNAAVLKSDPKSFALYDRRVDFLLTLGMPEEARKVLARAGQETQSGEAVNIGLARIAFHEGGADALRAEIASAKLDDSPHARTLIDTAHLHLLLDEADSANKLMARAMHASDFDAGRLNSPWFARWGLSDQLVLAVAEQRSGNSVAGAQHLQEISDLLDRLILADEERYGIYALKAEVLALRGDADGAMKALNRAANLGWRESWWAEREPYFASLRDRGDFRVLTTRVDGIDRGMRSAVETQR